MRTVDRILATSDPQHGENGKLVRLLKKAAYLVDVWQPSNYRLMVNFMNENVFLENLWNFSKKGC